MSLEAFKKKLNNMLGEYSFNFANDDDRDYLFEEYGGEEQFKSRFPAIYQSYRKARKAALKRKTTNVQEDSSSKDFTGSIGKLYIKPLSTSLKGADQYVQLTVPVSGTFIDTATKVDASDPAKGWIGVTIQASIKDRGSSDYLLNRSETVFDTNSYIDDLTSNHEKLSILNGKSYHTCLTLTGVNPEQELVKKHINQNQAIGDVKYYSIANIKIDDPAPKNETHRVSNEIMMLYGRIDQQPSYKDADYKGEDFLDNTFSDGKVHLLIPISGQLVFEYNVEPLELYKPEEGEVLSRSKASYDYKEQLFIYRSDIVNDTDLYTDLKKCFVKKEYSKSLQNTVDFNIKISDTKRSDYDWHTDVEGIQNGDPKTIMLTGLFTYQCKNQLGLPVVDQITIKSITKDDLAKINQQYYTYEKGSNIIYIPPITVYWGCFGKDVTVLFENKTEKAVSEVKIGDRILDTNGRILTVDNIFTGYDTEIVRIVCDNSREIQVSGGHPMMCEGQCVRAGFLKKGNRLNCADGSFAKIISIDFIQYNSTVYNFTFEEMDEGTYIVANGFCSGDLRMQNKRKEKAPRVYTAKEKALVAEMMLHTQELKQNSYRSFH